jgi:hypothetical protein
MWRLATLAMALAGCAVAPPAPLPYPPAARERMVALALGEWRDWGCPVQGLPGPSLAFCPAPRPAPPESAPEAFPRVLAYWRAAPQGAAAVAENRTRYLAALAGEAPPLGAPALWEEPFWSAAFISWVVASAGVDAPEFPPDARHAAYLDQLDTLAAAHPAGAPFLPRDPARHAPAPGDLVCFDRSGAPLARWADRAGERCRFRPLHCDVVVATGSGVVEAVGGNVADRVTLTRFAADGAGRLAPERPWLVVMENRLGRTGPWATAR